MLTVGFVGWRGMVGSVLMERFAVEGDFHDHRFYFFSTTQAGVLPPDITQSKTTVEDANDLEKLRAMNVIISCQGGDYTKKIHPELRRSGWNGYWIDAASTLRMDDQSVIILDPVNRRVIDKALSDGKKDVIGGNCTVSLMLMALGGLFENDLVEWLTSMTYQAASGAGASNMRELAMQMRAIGTSVSGLLDNPASTALEIDHQVMDVLRNNEFPVEYFGAPLAASLIPWIDRPMPSGQTREEWKGMVETNKILGRTDNPVPIDGQCVRVGSMRCHSQAFTIKLKKDVPLAEIEAMIASHNQWVNIIANNKEDTLRELSPANVSGTLTVPVGRIRKMNIGDKYLTAFSVGDQLLWGAAEPLRRILKIISEH